MTSFSNRIRVKILDLVRTTDQLSVYNTYLKNQYNYSASAIDNYQKQQLERIFTFHYTNNPIYKAYVGSKGYDERQPFDIQNVPCISKDFFKKNPAHSFVKDQVHITKRSGGSTGTPLTVHLSKDAIENFWPSIWRAFEMKGLQPCDKIMMIAGPSLFNNRTFQRKIYDFVNRFTVVSAFDLSDVTLKNAYLQIRKKKIKAIYGYTSSVLIFLQYLERMDYYVDLKAIFTTSETFIPAVRTLANRFCNCDVFDTYGANDGGVQAFECEQHSGYHLNFERCYVEVIDGEIVLTDFLNKAAPFIRYRVGDYTTSTHINKEKCACGRSLFRINNISGRINQFIEDIDSNRIHTEFFSHIFNVDQSIIQYQITQRQKKLYINIVHNNARSEAHYQSIYQPLIGQRFKMPFELVFNQPVKRLANMKTPILVADEN